MGSRWNPFDKESRKKIQRGTRKGIRAGIRAMSVIPGPHQPLANLMVQLDPKNHGISKNPLISAGAGALAGAGMHLAGQGLSDSMSSAIQSGARAGFRNWQSDDNPMLAGMYAMKNIPLMKKAGGDIFGSPPPGAAPSVAASRAASQLPIETGAGAMPGAGAFAELAKQQQAGVMGGSIPEATKIADQIGPVKYIKDFLPSGDRTYFDTIQDAMKAQEKKREEERQKQEQSSGGPKPGGTISYTPGGFDPTVLAAILAAAGGAGGGGGGQAPAPTTPPPQYDTPNYQRPNYQDVRDLRNRQMAGSARSAQ